MFFLQRSQTRISSNLATRILASEDLVDLIITCLTIGVLKPEGTMRSMVMKFSAVALWGKRCRVVDLSALRETSHNPAARETGQDSLSFSANGNSWWYHSKEPLQQASFYQADYSQASPAVQQVHSLFWCRLTLSLHPWAHLLSGRGVLTPARDVVFDKLMKS